MPEMQPPPPLPPQPETPISPQKRTRLRRFFSQTFEESPNLAILTSLVAASLIGLSAVFVRLSEVGPISTAFFRFFIAFPIVVTWMMFDNVKDKEYRLPAQPYDYGLMVLGGLFFALDLSTWHWSVELTTIINSTVLNNLASVFVAFFTWLIYRERPTSKLLMGICVSFTGAIVLAGQSFGLGYQNILGDLLGFLSAMFFAGYIMITKHLRHKFTAPTIMAWTSFSTMYFCAIFMIFEHGKHVPITIRGWITLIGLSLVVHIFGQGLMAYAIRHVSAGFTAICMLLGPVVASLIAWPLFNEPLSLIQMLGGLIVLAGVLIARKS